MFIVSSKREKSSIWSRLAAPLVAGLLFSAAYHGSAQAANATFVIADHDGYGVLECLTQKSDCGKMVADAFCESRGHGLAKAFGRIEDVTASISDAPREPPSPGAAIVSCAE